ncbi:hypothetical protein UFOVP774_1, partial [uncultured Caudovirales phage]
EERMTKDEIDLAREAMNLVFWLGLWWIIFR